MTTSSSLSSSSFIIIYLQRPKQWYVLKLLQNIYHYSYRVFIFFSSRTTIQSKGTQTLLSSEQQFASTRMFILCADSALWILSVKPHRWAYARCNYSATFGKKISILAMLLLTTLPFFICMNSLHSQISTHYIHMAK